MKKVLFLIHDLGPGGAEKVLVNLVNNMDSEKFDITVMALFGGGVNEQFLKPDIRFMTVFKRSFPGNSHVMKLFSPEFLHRIFIREKYDIEISYLEGPSARIISGCHNPRTKLVSWVHIQQRTEKTAVKAFRSWGESLECYKKFNRTVCVSEAVKEDFLGIYPEIENACVIYNTNETDRILNLKDEKIDEDFFGDDSFYICGVGKIVLSKGFDKLARIHTRLVNEGFKVKTCVLGAGPEQKNIERYLKEAKTESGFAFLGYRTTPYKYVSRCDVFVCCSKGEGFSTAAAEALIVGTPVVTTPAAGMEEMLGKNGEWGIITGWDEESLYCGIRRLLDDPELLAHYKEKSAERGKAFVTEKTVKAAEKMLAEL